MIRSILFSALTLTGVAAPADQPPRKPVVAARPHKVTLAKVRPSTMKGGQISDRALIKIEPSVAPGEEFYFDFWAYYRPGNGAGVSPYMLDDKSQLFRARDLFGKEQKYAATADEKWSPREPTGPLRFTYISMRITIHGQRRPVSAILYELTPMHDFEADWSHPFGSRPARIHFEWIAIDGKTVYGKEPKP